MMSRLLPRRCDAILFVIVGSMAAAPALAQSSKTIFCFTDGTQIGAERFETKEGKFLLYVPGSSSPLEYPAAKVCSVNVDPCNCAPTKAGEPHIPPPQPPTDAIHFGIHGSNTIGERLMPALIEAFARKSYGTTPTTKLGKPEEMEITLRSGSETKAVIDFESHGSGTAAKGLVEGKALIGMASRQLKQPEADSIRERFNIDAFAPENEHVLALDGLAVIVNPNNPVQKLTLEQIGRIFSGQATNWREFGGSDQPIGIYRRDDKSGTYDTFKSLVLGPLDLKVSPDAKKFESSELLVEAASKDPGGIGFIALPYVGKGNKAVDITSACGVTSAATRFSVKSEEYPLARRLFLYTNGAPSAPVARDLLKFALSDDAQSIVSDNEFINLSVEFQKPEDQRAWADGIIDNPASALGPDKSIPVSALRSFAQAMSHMRRTSMEFRFKHGSAELDTRALQDVERLGRYLSEPENANRKYYIVGFADADGGWPSNEELAARRAEAVARLLARQNVRVSRSAVKTFSYMAPVACNNDEAGKAKNRRVEIWIGQ